MTLTAGDLGTAPKGVLVSWLCKCATAVCMCVHTCVFVDCINAQPKRIVCWQASPNQFLRTMVPLEVPIWQGQF